MANQGIFPLSSFGIDVGKSFCFAACAQPAIDVFLFLDFGIFVYKGMELHGLRCCISGYISVILDYNTMHVDKRP